MPVSAMFGINPVSDRYYEIGVEAFNQISLSDGGSWCKKCNN